MSFPFAVLFRRKQLAGGVCAAVSLPQAEAFRTPPAVHPEEAELVKDSAPARRATFIGGRMALRIAMEDLDAEFHQSGQPILRTPRGAPAMPPGFVGSISHKREVAVALAARAETTPLTTVGIDVEIPRSLRTDIAPRVLTPAERAAIADLDPVARDAEVLLRFAAKEAIYKALDPWVRRPVSFQEVAIVTGGDGRRHARLALARDDGPFDVELHDASDGRLVLVVATVTAKKK